MCNLLKLIRKKKENGFNSRIIKRRIGNKKERI